MIFPTIPCVISPRIGADENGKPIFGSRVATLCAVIKLANAATQTNPKASRSASIGNATEMTSNSTLLFTPSTKIRINDLVTVGGIILSIEAIEQKMNHINGMIDHYQVSLKIYGT
jgi:hypothetical protein